MTIFCGPFLVEGARVPEESVLQAVPSPRVRTLLPCGAAAFLWRAPALQQACVDPSLLPHHIQVLSFAFSLYLCFSFIQAEMT